MFTRTDHDDGRSVIEHVNGDGQSHITAGWVTRRKIPSPSGTPARRGAAARAALKPGEGVIRIAAGLLALLAAGLLYVSFSAQYSYVLSERGQVSASLIEALSLDAGMIILSLLAFGLALNGQNAKTARILVMVFALGSGVMNYAAANDSSFKSVLAYSVPPLALAVIADQTVTTVRRHILHVRGEDEVSAWSEVGALIARVFRFTFGQIATRVEVRWVRAAEPAVIEVIPEVIPESFAALTGCRVRCPAPYFPGGPVPCVTAGRCLQPEQSPAPTKRERLETAYRTHADAWNPVTAARIATELAADIGMSAGTARGYVNELLKARKSEVA